MVAVYAYVWYRLFWWVEIMWLGHGIVCDKLTYVLNWMQLWLLMVTLGTDYRVWRYMYECVWDVWAIYRICNVWKWCDYGKLLKSLVSWDSKGLDMSMSGEINIV